MLDFENYKQEQGVPIYLQLMSFVSKALRNDDGYRRLAQCKTPDEMRRFFREVK